MPSQFRTLFEFTYPEELTLELRSGAESQGLRRVPAEPSEIKARLEIALDAAEDPLELRLEHLGTPAAQPCHTIAALFLDGIEHWLAGRERSPRSLCLVSTSAPELTAALLHEMRRRYIGDP